jgi:hypothetical protein
MKQPPAEWLLIAKQLDEFMKAAGFTPVGQDQYGLHWRYIDLQPVLDFMKAENSPEQVQ